MLFQIWFKDAVIFKNHSTNFLIYWFRAGPGQTKQFAGRVGNIGPIPISSN